MGLVFLEYEDAVSALRAQVALEGREFGEQRVQATLYDPAAFAAGTLL